MASSQVEFASPNPFGYVLRDHNQQDRCRDDNAKSQSSFHKNLKEFVRDHLHNRISVSACSSSSVDENSNRRINTLDCWTGQQQRKNNPKRLELVITDSKRDNGDESELSRRQSQILDRWAARQAREIITTIERQNQEAELLAVSNSQTVSSRASTFPTENSPTTQSDSFDEIPTLGASSLVHKWRGFEAETMHNQPTTSTLGSNSNSSSAVCSSRTDSGVCYTENSEDSFPDWGSDRTAQSDGGENERIRIADIIKKFSKQSSSKSLKSEENDHDHIHNQTEHIIHSPRIRGRQAFNDLLMHMERDRRRELDCLAEHQPVTKFPKRGRIQSLLRLRLLRREVAVEDQKKQHETASESDPLPQGSTIMLLREKFRTEMEHDGEVALNLYSPQGEPVNNNGDMGNSSKSFPGKGSIQCEQDITNQQQGTIPIQLSDNVLAEEARPVSEVTWEEVPSLHVDNCESRDTSYEMTSINDWEDYEEDEEELEDGDDDEEEEEEEEEDEEEQSNHYNYQHEWFSAISRPSEEWESRRQAWYHEMLDDPNLDNDEIRQLLQRKTVSNFLSSEFRRKMDHMLLSRCQGQTQTNQGLQTEEQEENIEHREGQDMEEEERESEEEEEEEEEEEGEEMEEGERENPIEQQYRVASDYFNRATYSLQLPLPSQLNSWDHDHHHEVGDESDRAASTSQTFDQDTPHSSSFTNHHPSIELELICDLRGQMEQLHREMSELRQSINCCMDMQIKLQRCIKSEVQSPSVLGEGKKSQSKAPKKGSCCICYEVQVDSLLYRCGHMCTCFKCAHELQWSSGKCPICRAPILDVVRAYADDS